MTTTWVSELANVVPIIVLSGPWQSTRVVGEAAEPPQLGDTSLFPTGSSVLPADHGGLPATPKRNRSWRKFQKQLSESTLGGFEVLREEGNTACKDERRAIVSSAWQSETESWQSRAVLPYWIQGK